MTFGEFLEACREQARLVRAAPIPHAAAFCVSTAISFLVIQWGYGRVIDQKNAEIETLNTKVSEIQLQAGRSGPPRRLTKAQIDQIGKAALSLKNGTMPVAVYFVMSEESRDYAQQIANAFDEFRKTPKLALAAPIYDYDDSEKFGLHVETTSDCPVMQSVADILVGADLPLHRMIAPSRPESIGACGVLVVGYRPLEN